MAFCTLLALSYDCQIWGVTWNWKMCKYGGREMKDIKHLKNEYKKKFWIQLKRPPSSGLHARVTTPTCFLNAPQLRTPDSATCCSNSPSVSNTVFCHSSLLAYAGAHKVVIFFKVCMGTLLLSSQSSQMCCHPPHRMEFICCFCRIACYPIVGCKDDVHFSSLLQAGYLPEETGNHTHSSRLKTPCAIATQTELQCQAGVKCRLNGNANSLAFH